MKKDENLKNSKASLFGYGLTTKAIAEFLGQKMGGFEIYDDNFTNISKDEFGNILKPISEFVAEKSNLEIPSPGFPCEHELVKKAKHLISEYDFFYDAMPKSVWISGTNGKTTTTQMTWHLLKHINAVMGGNVGIPLAKLDINANLWILETSSFTLHYTKTAKPEIYALLPITKDHISWHKTYANYIKSKLNVLKRMHENDVAILPLELREKVKTKAYVIFYEDEFDLAKKMGINIKQVHFKSPFLLDAILALSIEKVILDSISYEKINAFKIEKNKLEEFFDSQKRLWVNDTKATNLDACEAALKRYKEKKIHLILGGDSKGVSLKPLFEKMYGLKLEIYAIGSCENEILTLAKKYKIKAHSCQFLKTAVSKIALSLKKGELALLSPACASLDQFSSYAQRGDVFKECVKKL